MSAKKKNPCGLMNSAEILVLTGTDSAKPYVAVVDVNLCMLCEEPAQGC